MPLPEFPHGNSIDLTVHAKDGFAAAVPAAWRGRVVLRGEAGVIVGEVCRMFAHNADQDRDVRRPWALVLWGEVNDRPGSPFWSCLTGDAAFPVAVRRKAWPIERICKYTNIPGTLAFEVFDVTGENTWAPAPLTAEDFAADDWEVVDNPNRPEEDLEPEPDNVSCPEDN